MITIGDHRERCQARTIGNYEREYMMSTFYDGAIIAVIDLREGGDVRRSPLTVIMVLTMVVDKHIPCLRRLCNPVLNLLAGVHQSQEEFNSWPVASEAKSVRDFFHSLILCGTCTWCTRQLIVDGSKWALHCLTITAG